MKIDIEEVLNTMEKNLDNKYNYFNIKKIELYDIKKALEQQQAEIERLKKKIQKLSMPHGYDSTNYVKPKPPEVKK